MPVYLEQNTVIEPGRQDVGICSWTRRNRWSRQFYLFGQLRFTRWSNTGRSIIRYEEGAIDLDHSQKARWSSWTSRPIKYRNTGVMSGTYPKTIGVPVSPHFQYYSNTVELDIQSRSAIIRVGIEVKHQNKTEGVLCTSQIGHCRYVWLCSTAERYQIRTSRQTWSSRTPTWEIRLFLPLHQMVPETCTKLQSYCTLTVNTILFSVSEMFRNTSLTFMLE